MLTPQEYQVYRTLSDYPSGYSNKAEYAAYLTKYIKGKASEQGYTFLVDRFGMDTVKAVFPKVNKAVLDAEQYLYKSMAYT